MIRDPEIKHDQVLLDLVDYIQDYEPTSETALNTARYCLMDALGCAIEALSFPACTRLLGPLVPEEFVSIGAKVPGTGYILDPVRAAFNIGTMVRWLDSNDTILAAERGHPSDNLGAILATADYVSRRHLRSGRNALSMFDVLKSMVKAHEVQGGLSLQNSFTAIGLDHAVLVRIASAAVATQILGGSKTEILSAVSHAFADGAPMKVYRQSPNICSRKSWAAGDATSRGVFLALMALKGEAPIPTVLTAKTYGFYDAVFNGKAFTFERPLGSYVMENILFKSFPAEMMCQSIAECAIELHAVARDKLDQIERVDIATQAQAMGIVDKSGPLRSPADRDHCLQYVCAVGLIFGRITGFSFEDDFARDPRIDRLRSLMSVVENPTYTADHFDVGKRSSANAVQVFFKDGTKTKLTVTEYPKGHPRRRAEGFPMLREKSAASFGRYFPPERTEKILQMFEHQESLMQAPVSEFIDLLVL